MAALAASRHAVPVHRCRLCERRSPPSTPPAYPARSAGRTVPPTDARVAPTTATHDLTTFRARCASQAHASRAMNGDALKRKAEDEGAPEQARAARCRRRMQHPRCCEVCPCCCWRAADALRAAEGREPHDAVQEAHHHVGGGRGAAPQRCARCSAAWQRTSARSARRARRNPRRVCCRAAPASMRCVWRCVAACD